MTHRRGSRTPGKDDAISSVLGAILVFGLLVIALLTIQVKFVPVWDRDREADHMQTLGNQLGQIKSDLDRMADNRTVVPLADPLKLRPSSGGFRFFSSQHPGAEVSLHPAAAGQGFALSTNQAHVFSQDGASLFAGSETWTQVIAGDTITNVGSVQNLRLRITNPASWGTGDSISVHLTNATGAYAGKMVVTNIDHGTTYSLRFETFAASSPTIPVTITEEAFNKNSPPTYQYIDLLRQDFQFRQVLALAQAPSALTLERNNLDVDYTAAYTVVNAGGGSTQVGGGGTLVPDFARRILSGSLVVASRNQQYADQTYVVEHGAVILAQPDGAVMYVAPSMSVNVVAGVVDVRWVVPGVQGVATTVSGPATATVNLNPGTPASFVASMPILNVALTTLYGDVWAQHWTTLLQSAGLAYGTEFTVTSNTTAAQLSIRGLQSDPDSLVDDLVMNFRGATLTATPRAGA